MTPAAPISRTQRTTRSRHAKPLLISANRLASAVRLCRPPTLAPCPAAEEDSFHGIADRPTLHLADMVVMSSPIEFQSKILRRRKSPTEYGTYRAGLEWDLDDPIVIESQDDLKSTLRWRERLEPYHHQVTNLITFCRRLPVTL